MRRLSSLPLGWRLALLFAAISVLGGGVLGVFLYQSFADELTQRDEIQLLGKLHQVRLLLSNASTPRLILEQPQYLRDTMSGESNAHIQIQDEQGRVLLDTHPQQPLLPPDQLVATQADPGLSDISRWSTAAGVPVAGVAAFSELGSNKASQPVTQVRIQVVRVYADRAMRLAAYRKRIWMGVTLAALATALLASALLWWGLLPLRRLTELAGQITTQRMSARLPADQAPAEIHGLILAFNAMLGRLEKGFDQVNQFAADLAHELRTPLSNLLGQSQVLLAKPREAEEYEALLASNIEELERLNRMIDSMLFLARAEHGSPVLEREPLNLHDEFARQCDYFHDLADDKGLTFKLDVEAAQPLLAQPILLRRALANLLSNALRHAPAGSTVQLVATRLPQAWALRVTNTADLLPEGAPERLFERFYRVDPSRTDSAQSSGLGLAIVRSIMLLHGGCATVNQCASTGEISFCLVFPD